MNLETFKETYSRFSQEFGSINIIPHSYVSYQKALIDLIYRHPFLFPPYLEKLESLEVMGSVREYEEFLTYSYTQFKSFLTFKIPMHVWISELSFQDILSLEFLIQRFQQKEGKSVFDSYLLWSISLIIKDILSEEQISLPKRFIIKKRFFVDTNSLKMELRNKNPFWFLSTTRQKKLPNHQFTQTINLRVLQHLTETPVQIDGPHESIRTPEASYFENTLTFVENFARVNNFGLGRVALVRLCPKGLVYRHTDDEIQLKNRLRFHLIIEAEPSNYFILGDEITRVQEGELWEYSNKTMHKSYNTSNTWRTNIIFDAYPV